MGESKHTIGPWRVFEGSDPTDNPGIESDAAGISIVVFGRGARGVKGRGPEAANANARLIAAAPELLEALKMAEPWIESGPESSWRDSVLARVRAAIAKAEGAPCILDPFDVMRSTRVLAPHDPKLNDIRWLIGEALRRVHQRITITTSQDTSGISAHAVEKMRVCRERAGVAAWPIVSRIVLEGFGVRDCRSFVPEIATPWRADAVVTDRLRVALDALGELVGVTPRAAFMTLLPIILICVSGVPITECAPQYGARVVVRGEPSGNEIMCALNGQETLASTAQGQHLADGETIKVMCERVKQ